MTIDFLAELDTALAVSKQYRLTREEKAFIAKEEQGAYESKLDEITTIRRSTMTSYHKEDFGQKATYKKTDCVFDIHWTVTMGRVGFLPNFI